MVKKRAWYVLRMILPYVLLLALIPVAATQAFSATRFLRRPVALVGPKANYLALGDSLAFGYQPNFDWANGYASVFFNALTKHGVQHYDNLACPDENSNSMINGGCPYALLHKFIYSGSQLQAAVRYLRERAGQVSPVTLDIGANDLIPDLNLNNCTINAKWQSDLATLDNNLKNVILPQLGAAMTVNGQMTGDLIVLNYYDPYQDRCPGTLANIQALNQHLAADISGHAILVDIYGAFAAPITSDTPTPVSHLCVYTWMCSASKNIHPNQVGYSLMASSIEHTVNY